MKILYSNFEHMNWTKPLVFFLFFFVLVLNANAWSRIIANLSNPIKNSANQVGDGPDLAFEWQSCPNISFTPLACISPRLVTERDYEPLAISATTEVLHFLKFPYTAQLSDPSTDLSEGFPISNNMLPPSGDGSIAPLIQTICYGALPAGFVLTGNMGAVINWEYSSDEAFTSPQQFGPVTTATTVPGAWIQFWNLSSDTWFRARTLIGAGPAFTYSETALISFYPPLLGSHNTVPENQCSGFDPAVLTLTAAISGGKTPYTYQWQLNGADVVSENTDTFDPPVLNSMGTYRYNCVVKDDCGKILTTTKKVITIQDILPPTFTCPILGGTYCVEDISSAVYNNVPVNDPTDLTTLRPDYYTFVASSVMLDITDEADNCALAAIDPISWTIDFGNDGTINLSGTGQLSTYGADIQFPAGTNTITYTLTDAAGKKTIQSVNLEVKPRPDIVKVFI